MAVGFRPRAIPEGRTGVVSGYPLLWSLLARTDHQLDCPAPSLCASVRVVLHTSFASFLVFPNLSSIFLTTVALHYQVAFGIRIGKTLECQL